MAAPALNFLATTATRALGEHYQLVSGADDDLALLARDTCLMSAYLQELEEELKKKPKNKKLLEQYRIEVRDAAYRAKDIIDECVIRAARRMSNKFRRFVSPKSTSLAHQVRAFRQDIIKPLFHRYGIGAITSLQQIPISIATNPNEIIAQAQENIIGHGGLTSNSTSAGEENIIGHGAQASSSTSAHFLNGELKHQIIEQGQENIIGHGSLASNSTLAGEENVIGHGVQASSSTSARFLNGELKHQITQHGQVNMIGHGGQASSSTQLLLLNGEIMHHGQACSTQFLKEELKPQTCPRRGTVVGFREEADTIINFLCEESMQLEVISIIGMPGKGKTTLARKIMKDERVACEFLKLIWVDVTQNYNKRDVYLKILTSLTQDKDMSNLSDDVLASTIKVYLQNQKFLLILDDVWINAWEDIEAALPKANKLGKVLITSRHGSVAVKANWSREAYQLDILDESKSWELLQLQVFDNLGMCPPDLVQIGKKIAKACGGVPLAIVVIGGILLKICSTSTGFNETRVKWEKVSNNVSMYYDDDDEDRTRNVIALSCNQLSSEVRDCFLYLGTFPEDKQISVARLTYLWIGEDLIGRQPNMSLEEVAYSYVKDLIDRNLVMVDRVKYDGFIKTCRVHNMIRELCKGEASFVNQNLFQEMEMSGEGTFDPPVAEVQSRRRISIHSHVDDFLREKPEGPRVHSFLCFADDTVILKAADTSLIPIQFTRLRVIDIKPIKLPIFPSKITNLLLLSYISFSGDGLDFRVVPKEISKLWNLKILIIETELPTIEIKANIWKMIHLRHVKTKAAIVLRNKTKGRGGEELQSFSRLSTKCCTEGVFNKAKNLKNLGVRGDLADILEIDCFRVLYRVQKFKLVHDIDVSSVGRLHSLPNHDRFPPNLRTLQISGTYLPWNRICVLAKLPFLQVLILKNNAFTGKYWKAANACFATLEILVIEGTDLGRWTGEDGYFPKLRCLALKDCNDLEQVPLQHLKNLERLHLERVCESAVKDAVEKQMGEGGGFELIINSGGKSWR